MTVVIELRGRRSGPRDSRIEIADGRLTVLPPDGYEEPISVPVADLVGVPHVWPGRTPEGLPTSATGLWHLRRQWQHRPSGRLDARRPGLRVHLLLREPMSLPVPTEGAMHTDGVDVPRFPYPVQVEGRVLADGLTVEVRDLEDALAALEAAGVPVLHRLQVDDHLGAPDTPRARALMREDGVLDLRYRSLYRRGGLLGFLALVMFLAPAVFEGGPEQLLLAVSSIGLLLLLPASIVMMVVGAVRGNRWMRRWRADRDAHLAGTPVVEWPSADATQGRAGAAE